ncbi:hypothetical protein TBLA_0F03520 [Henningerozyma blattae CBS 6284]|uniref:Uncharacterized protein n=1 Tax=Henningerozyma blattae (strain ATCC 34711 / CBS 6284 / DSM 70876 / NBRC 10599 / NRRL Y-10934 / UCD 77-7) TaxID=1071380 RepID=I2H687_HENB6|nr:hypothetical protein TBLA_0F03520 [Tetrapisispora blattae CBS 6284]CCH61889.1 hypothetical protein TBLA_0F03520 [Tetrapisispora blattae CBS 6284]
MQDEANYWMILNNQTQTSIGANLSNNLYICTLPIMIDYCFTAPTIPKYMDLEVFSAKVNRYSNLGKFIANEDFVPTSDTAALLNRIN